MLDSTRDAITYLSLNRLRRHTLAIQVDSAGFVSHVCLMTYETSKFRPSVGDRAPSHRPTTQESVLTLLDRLCEALGDKLREVIIALSLPNFDDGDVHAELALAEELRELRSQMPAMAARGSLAFRMTQKSWQELCLDREMDEVVFKNMFKYNGLYWTDIVLDDEPC